MPMVILSLPYFVVVVHFHHLSHLVQGFPEGVAVAAVEVGVDGVAILEGFSGHRVYPHFLEVVDHDHLLGVDLVFLPVDLYPEDCLLAGQHTSVGELDPT